MPKQSTLKLLCFMGGVVIGTPIALAVFFEQVNDTHSAGYSRGFTLGYRVGWMDSMAETTRTPEFDNTMNEFLKEADEECRKDGFDVEHRSLRNNNREHMRASPRKSEMK